MDQLSFGSLDFATKKKRTKREVFLAEIELAPKKRDETTARKGGPWLHLKVQQAAGARLASARTGDARQRVRETRMRTR